MGAYKSVRNVYDLWVPEHFKRICSVIDSLPADSDFDASEYYCHSGSPSHPSSRDLCNSLATETRGTRNYPSILRIIAFYRTNWWYQAPSKGYPSNHSRIIDPNGEDGSKEEDGGEEVDQSLADVDDFSL